MSKIMKGGVEYPFGSGGSNMKILTRAEYDALVTAGTVESSVYYFISEDELNKNSLSFPNYSGMITAIESVGTGETKTSTWTADENCYVIGATSSGSTSAPMFLRVKIDSQTVFESFSITRNYNYLRSAMYPVKKGSVVEINEEVPSTGNFKLLKIPFC